MTYAESTDENGTETVTEVVTHWGCELIIESSGKPVIVRWDPGYGSGVYTPYTEAEARADVARPDKGYTKRLVTRTETTTTVTTAWEAAE